MHIGGSKNAVQKMQKSAKKCTYMGFPQQNVGFKCKKIDHWGVPGMKIWVVFQMELLIFSHDNVQLSATFYPKDPPPYFGGSLECYLGGGLP